MDIFDNIPESAQSFFKEIKNINANFTSEDDPKHLFLALNYGILSEEFMEDRSDDDFLKSLNIKQIYPGIGNLHYFDVLLKRENTLITISNALSRVSISSSVWTKHHNKGNFFYEGSTLIIGSFNRIENCIYFWNIRATYPHSVNIWIPIELFDENFQTYFLKNFKHYCLLTEEKSEDIRSIIRSINSSCTEIDGSKYYFHTIENGWNSYEFIQNCMIESGKIRIIHPQNKLFSKIGFNINLAIEIKGLAESYLPKSLELGRLFDQGISSEPQHFTRMSSRGLTNLFSDVNPLNETSFLYEVNIPKTEEIFSTLFREKRITLKETKNTQIINQVIFLLKGLDNLKILTDHLIFKLIVKLSPKRMDKLVKDIAIEIKQELSEEEIRQILIKKVGEITTIYSEIILQASQFASILGISKKEMESLHDKIQNLYKLNILLRGKKIVCPSCKQILWYPLSKLSDSLSCYCCNNLMSLPIFDNSKVEEDSFKLNELLISATDQGALPVLLTVNILNQQKFASKKFIFDYEIFDEDTLIGEIDIIFNLGRRVGLAEVKADRGFEEKQIEKLIKNSKRIDADLLVFSTLKVKTSNEVLSLIESLKQHELTIPAFIFTKEVLFSQTSRDLSKYFEIRDDDNFPSGPILID